MRHGETVYNAARRLQANDIHTPLTRLGCEQAAAMGEALRGALGNKPDVTLHISETGRALQTAALIAQELGIDWFGALRTHDLKEIDMGSWCGRTYDEVEAELGPIVTADHLLRPAPDGEDYPAIAARLNNWLANVVHDGRDHLVVMHGISSRVLRGIMAGYPVHPEHGVPIAPSLVQGSVALIEDGAESVFLGASRGTEHA
jgi:probable phosphoglycerate mutase